MINTSNITGAGGIVDLMIAINVVSGGIFGFCLWLSPYIVISIIFLRFGFKAASSSACFVGVITALLLRLMGLINDTLLFTSIALIVGLVLMLWFDRE